VRRALPGDGAPAARRPNLEPSMSQPDSSRVSTIAHALESPSSVSVSAAWPFVLQAEASAAILKRFILRDRGFISHARHL